MSQLGDSNRGCCASSCTNGISSFKFIVLSCASNGLEADANGLRSCRYVKIRVHQDPVRQDSATDVDIGRAGRFIGPKGLKRRTRTFVFGYLRWAEGCSDAAGFNSAT